MPAAQGLRQKNSPSDRWPGGVLVWSGRRNQSTGRSSMDPSRILSGLPIRPFRGGLSDDPSCGLIAASTARVSRASLACSGKTRSREAPSRRRRRENRSPLLPAWARPRRRAQDRTIRRAQPKRRRADCGLALAWASMAVPAWTRMLYRAKFVLSSATFTSLMRLLAAERLSFDTPNCS